MSRTIDSPNDFQSFQEDSSPARQVQEALRGKSVCPFCGGVAESGDGACAKCTMENSPLTRQATKARLGPWYVLQTRNPSAPGMKYSVLLALVKKGQITPRSIVRGPTTNQFWRFAAKVRGLSREFGICWGCGQDIETQASVCPHCQRNQEPPAHPDQLLDSRQPLSQVLPVRREVRPSFQSESREAAAQETMHPQRQRVQLPGPQHELSLDELAEQEAVQQRMALQGRRLPSLQPVLPQQDPSGRPMPIYRDVEPQQPLGKVLLLLGLMAAFTVAGWLYVDANSRQKVFGWAQTTWNDLTNGDTTPTPRGTTGPNRPAGEKIVLEAPAAPAPTAQAPSPQPPAPQATPAPEASPVLPQEPLAAAVPAPTLRIEEPAAPIEQPAPRIEQPTPPAPRVQEVKPQVQIAVGGASGERPESHVEVHSPAGTARVTGDAPDVATTDPEELVNLSRKLWRQAIDAEARGDWSEAVRLYEQIKRMPAMAWHSGIDIRLADARRRAQ